MVRRAFPSLAFVALVLAGCGGGGGSKGGDSSGPAESVTIIAPTTAIKPGGTFNFTAIVKGGGTVVWSVVGGSANGTITSGGVYKAPMTQGFYTIQATVGGIVATQSVAVDNGIGVSLTALGATPLTVPKSTLLLSAAVTGSTDKKIIWKLTNATGGAVGSSVTSIGSYTFTAPTTVGTYTVTGTSHADSTKQFSLPIQVVANVNVRFKWTDFNGTPKDDTVFSLDIADSPNTVANFVSLVNNGFYNGIKIHRYEAGFVVQFGSPKSRTATLAQLQDFEHGGVNDVTSSTSVPFEPGMTNVAHVLAAASTSAPGPAGDQVFIELTAQPTFDGKYDAFGKVVSGDAAVDLLRAGDTIVSAKTEAP